MSTRVDWLAATTGRSRVRDEAPPELHLAVTLGMEAPSITVEGSRVGLDGTLLHVTGPARDVFVVVDDVPLARAHGADLVFDLQSAHDRRAASESGSPVDVRASQRAMELEACTGIRHGYEILPDPAPPATPIALVVRSDEALDGCRACWTTDGAPPVDPGATSQGAVALAPTDDARLEWRGQLPGQPGGTRVRYRIAACADGHWRPVADAAPGFTRPVPHLPYARPPREEYSYVVGPPEPPVWARDAVFYHLLVDRFARHDGGEIAPPGECEPLGFAGGTLRGALERLDHVVQLGVDVVLLSPITPGEMHCSYDAKDLCGVDPRLGTLDDARAFCQEAHRQGLRVVLDLELSYLGGRHPIALEAVTDPSSASRDWFHGSVDPPRLWGWMGGNPMFRPIDHHHEPARRALLDSLRFWLDVGFDGFRLDSAHAAPLDFWAEVGAVAHQHQPEAFLFGEITAPRAERLRLRGRLTGYLDFDVEHAIRGLVGTGDASPSDLDRAAHGTSTEPSLVPLAFVECHDDSRLSLLTDGDEGRIRLGHLLLLTLPGPPVLLYGTEIGLNQHRPGHLDLELRQRMPWDNVDEGRLAWMSAMVRLRREHPALRSGLYETVLVADDEGCLAYARVDAGGTALVVANASDGPTRPRLSWKGRTIAVELDPWEGRVLDADGTPLASSATSRR